MNKATLEKILASHGMKVDGTQGNVGHFKDLEIGVAEPHDKLCAVRMELSKNGIAVRDMRIMTVDNDVHKDYGKIYLQISSFWYE